MSRLLMPSLMLPRNKVGESYIGTNCALVLPADAVVNAGPDTVSPSILLVLTILAAFDLPIDTACIPK